MQDHPLAITNARDRLGWTLCDDRFMISRKLDLALHLQHGLSASLREEILSEEGGMKYTAHSTVKQVNLDNN